MWDHILSLPFISCVTSVQPILQDCLGDLVSI